MKERPIILSGPDVLAVLDMEKTQFRRVVSPGSARCPFGRQGGVLWVRETLRRTPAGVWFYAADEAPVAPKDRGAMTAWAHHRERDTCPSIHMPKWACRLRLRVTGVRVEGLQEIDSDQIIYEWHEVGCPECPAGDICETCRGRAVDTFADSWDSLHKPGKRWDDNPWVWCISFTSPSNISHPA